MEPLWLWWIARYLFSNTRLLFLLFQLGSEPLISLVDAVERDLVRET